MRQSNSPTNTTTATTLANANVVQPHDTDVDSNLNKFRVKSGKLMLLHRVGHHTIRLPVFVRVYRNSFEHFAVVSRDQAIPIHSTYTNLRTSTCTISKDHATQIELVQNSYEGFVITFDTGVKDSVSEWVEAFTSSTPPCSPTQCRVPSTIPRSLMLPTLLEVDEKE